MLLFPLSYIRLRLWLPVGNEGGASRRSLIVYSLIRGLVPEDAGIGKWHISAYSGIVMDGWEAVEMGKEA
jgi:hypothetical protein